MNPVVLGIERTGEQQLAPGARQERLGVARKECGNGLVLGGNDGQRAEHVRIGAVRRRGELRDAQRHAPWPRRKRAQLACQRVDDVGRNR